MQRLKPTIKALCLILLIWVPFHCPPSLAADAREAHPFGLFWSGNENYPGTAGVNIGINASNFMRFTTGVSIFHDAPGSAFETIPNTLIALMVYMITAGNTPIEDTMEFLTGDSTPPASLFGYGAGVEFLVPGWQWSPSLGVHYTGFDVSNQAMEFTDGHHDHIYYSLGIDYQAESGFLFALGGLYAPNLNIEVLQYRGYLRLGWMF